MCSKDRELILEAIVSALYECVDDLHIFAHQSTTVDIARQLYNAAEVRPNIDKLVKLDLVEDE